MTPTPPVPPTPEEDARIAESIADWIAEARGSKVAAEAMDLREIAARLRALAAERGALADKLAEWLRFEERSGWPTTS